MVMRFFKKPVLDKDKVILMDFQNFKNGVEFMYVLPLQQTKLYLSRHIFLKDFYMKKIIEKM